MPHQLRAFKARTLAECDAVAVAIRRDAGFTDLEAVDLRDLASRMTVDGERVRLGRSSMMTSRDLWAASGHDERYGFRVLLCGDAWNELETGEARTRFSLAHELGHVVLHCDELRSRLWLPFEEHSTSRVRRPELDIERQANWFAGALLVPRSAALRLSAEALADRYGVSVAAAGYRRAEVGAA